MRKVGVAFVVIVALAAAGYFLWLSRRPVKLMHDAIQPGMTVRQVITLSPKWTACYLTNSDTDNEESRRFFQVRNNPELHTYRITVSSYPEDKKPDGISVPDAEALAKIIDTRIAESKQEWRMGFHFPGARRRSFFTVFLGADGKVSHVSNIFVAD